MSNNVHMEEREWLNELKIRLKIRNNIHDLPTDTEAQRVEHRRDKPRTSVQILASVILFICSAAFFLPLLPWRSVDWSNFDRGLQRLNNGDSINDIQK